MIPKSHYRSAGIIALICAAYGILNAMNQRFTLWDLYVYYGAAGHLLDGQSPYLEAFGLSSGYYKYSPFAALVFMPFHALGWLGARVVFFTLLTASLAVGLPALTGRMREVFPTAKGSFAWVVAAVAITLAGHFSRELLLGNVNWLLLLAVMAAFFSLDRHRWLPGLLIGLVLVFKPHFAVLLPWLVLRSRWRDFGVTILTVIVALFLPAAGWGWTYNTELLREWLATMQMHNQSLAESPNTFYGVPARLLGWEGSWPIVLTLALVAMGILAFVLRHVWREATANASKTRHMLLEFAVIMALIPNLVHTDTEHFMWTLPLVMVLAIHFPRLGRLPKVFVGLLWLLCLIPYTLATPDLWGADGSRWLEQSGVLGWANAVLVILAVTTVPKEE